MKSVCRGFVAFFVIKPQTGHQPTLRDTKNTTMFLDQDWSVKKEHVISYEVKTLSRYGHLNINEFNIHLATPSYLLYPGGVETLKADRTPTIIRWEAFLFSWLSANN